MRSSSMAISNFASSVELGQVYQNFIGGSWKNALSGETFISTNPARTSEVIGHYQKSNAADLEEAVEAAMKAQPAWEAIPAPVRGEVLYRAALILQQHLEKLAQLMTREMGKILR